LGGVPVQTLLDHRWYGIGPALRGGTMSEAAGSIERCVSLNARSSSEVEAPDDLAVESTDWMRARPWTCRWR
jgi:hypothetical protein